MLTRPWAVGQNLGWSLHAPRRRAVPGSSWGRHRAHPGPGPILGHIENAYVQTLSSVSTEAASGRRHNTLVKKVEKLKAKLEKSISPVPLGRRASPWRATTRCRRQGQICGKPQGHRKVHKLATRKGLTLCYWAWRNSPPSKLCASALGPPWGRHPFLHTLQAQEHDGPWPR